MFRCDVFRAKQIIIVDAYYHYNGQIVTKALFHTHPIENNDGPETVLNIFHNILHRLRICGVCDRGHTKHIIRFAGVSALWISANEKRLTQQPHPCLPSTVNRGPFMMMLMNKGNINHIKEERMLICIFELNSFTTERPKRSEGTHTQSGEWIHGREGREKNNNIVYKKIKNTKTVQPNLCARGDGWGWGWGTQWFFFFMMTMNGRNALMDCDRKTDFFYS